MRTVFLALILSLSLLLGAQPTITNAGGPTVGDVWYYFDTDEAAQLTIGSPGEDQNWVFTDFTQPFDTSEISFTAIADLSDPFSAVFPEAEVAEVFENGVITVVDYYDVTNDGLYWLGTAYAELGESPSVQESLGDGLIIPYDITYGDVRSDLVHIYVDTLDLEAPTIIKSYDMSTMVADAYGSVSTPAGNYDGAQRIRLAQYEVDSVFVDDDMDGVFTFTEVSDIDTSNLAYFFIQNASPSLICSISLDPETGAAEEFSYNSNEPSGLDELSSLELDLYPNPSTGWVRIETPEGIGSAVLQVTDSKGRSVMGRQLVQQAGTTTIDLSQLSKGMYQVDLISGDTVRRTKLVIE